MKKNILLLVCAVMMSLSSVLAANIGVQQARTVALNFFKITLGNTHTQVTATLQYTRTETDNTVDFYVFNMSPVKGFVIVSATDNDEPIIGYSTESAFPSDFSKIGLNVWLARWGQELHYVILNNRIASSTAAAHWVAYYAGVAPVSMKSSSVSPLCQTTWDQNTEYGTGPNLYNNFCPGGTGSNQAVTGCVATAMSQIMKYWSYPAVGIGSHTYDDATNFGYTENYGNLTANFADSTFSWVNMPLTLTNTSSATQINAIGRIMSCAGISVDMDYSPTGSGAAVMISESGSGPSAESAYVQYFGYQNIIKEIGLTGTGSGANIILSSAQFTDSVEAELNAGRLVEVEGSDATYGGHTWVCDGYDVNNNLHMNWGWSGYADGYFAITSLNPNAGSEQLDFTQDIGALTHIIPPPHGGSITETASAVNSAVCPGTPTQLNATTHTGATYSWTPTTGLSNSTIANPVATPTSTTTYSVTADSAGVTASSSVTITVYPKPTATMGTPTEPSCSGSSNGSVTVVAAGGTSGYNYLWSNGGTTATASNLAGGTYTVTVTDAKSCTATATKTLTEPTALSVSVTPTNATGCGQSNGSVAASISGGTSGYTYHWSNGATTADISNIQASTYDLTVTDARGCSATAAAVVASPGSMSISASGTAVSCYGSSTGSASVSVSGSSGTVTYHWSNGATTSSIQNVAASTYTVTVSETSGCSETATETVQQPTAALSAVVNVVNAQCAASNGSATASVTGGTGGYFYSWSTGGNTSSVSGVIAGTYWLTVTDANHCTVVSSAVISSVSSMSASVTSQNAACYDANNGSGRINLSNGTAPYTYNWSNGASSSSVSGLAPGSYSVTITDANHCSASGSISVSQPDQIQLSTSSSMATGSQDNGSAGVSNVSGATAPYTYNWSNGSTTQSVSNIAAGTYTVTVTDAHGCSQTATDVVGDRSSTGIISISNDIVFSVYPNPAGQQVFVQVNQLDNSTTLNLRNILGQTVISQVLTSTQIQLDLSALADGVYLVELRQAGKAAVKELVVTK